MGSLLTIKGLAAVIMGGLGQVNGGIYAAFILGMVESLFGGYISFAFKDVISFGLFIVILFLRPQGMFREEDWHMIVRRHWHSVGLVTAVAVLLVALPQFLPSRRVFRQHYDPDGGVDHLCAQLRPQCGARRNGLARTSRLFWRERLHDRHREPKLAWTLSAAWCSPPFRCRCWPWCPGLPFFPHQRCLVRDRHVGALVVAQLIANNAP